MSDYGTMVGRLLSIMSGSSRGPRRPTKRGAGRPRHAPRTRQRGVWPGADAGLLMAFWLGGAAVGVRAQELGRDRPRSPTRATSLDLGQTPPARRPWRTAAWADQRPPSDLAGARWPPRSPAPVPSRRVRRAGPGWRGPWLLPTVLPIVVIGHDGPGDAFDVFLVGPASYHGAFLREAGHADPTWSGPGPTGRSCAVAAATHGCWPADARTTAPPPRTRRGGHARRRAHADQPLSTDASAASVGQRPGARATGGGERGSARVRRQA